MRIVTTSVRSVHEFACNSKACAPPPVGSGGSTASSGIPSNTRAAMGGASIRVNGSSAKIGKKPKVIDAKDSPHYKTRGDMRAISEAEGAQLVKSVKQAADALDNSATKIAAGKLKPLAEGRRVGLRPQLNVLKQTGKLVQTIHDASQKSTASTAASRSVLGYAVSATVRNALLNVNQQARANIALGRENKFPMSSVDGNYVEHAGPHQFDGIEVRFNPKRTHLYVDPDGRPVKSAEEATVVGTPEGPRVFVRGRIEYYDESDYPQPLGGAATDAVLASGTVVRSRGTGG